MSPYRIALANIRIPSTPDESVALAVRGVADAGAAGARVVCFPECFVPGYRVGRAVPAPTVDEAFLQAAWDAVGDAARKANIAVVLGTERFADDGPRISVMVFNADGSVAGYQDKVQLDPSEDPMFTSGEGWQVFRAGELLRSAVPPRTPSITRPSTARAPAAARPRR